MVANGRTDWKKELEETMTLARKMGLDFMLIDASNEKGYSYPYLLYIPKNPRGTIVMDCLNDYENEMHGRIENPAGIEEVYSLFREEERIAYETTTTPEKIELEDKEQTAERIYERTGKGMIALARLVKNFGFNASAIVPLIPGFNSGEEINKVNSQLDKDVILDVVPQIKAIIEDAKKIIKEKRPEIELEEKIMPVGHSKSSTFANNFVAYYPEMCKAAILLGGEFSTLPIDEIALQIVKEDEISDNEQFQMVDGKVTKKISQSDFDRIRKEYEDEKREYQGEITLNPNGTYNLPMNFPIGIADIEHYRNLSDYPGGKDAYKKALLDMHKMVGVGEQEETKPGHYAYLDSVTLEGIEVKAGQDLTPLQESLGRDLFEIEQASMHNRVLEYIDATRVLFGRSVNEKLRNFAQLSQLLDMPIQTQIYKGVGHTNFKYSDSMKELTGISSRAMFESKILREDMKQYYEGVDSGDIRQLEDRDDRAQRVSPVPQLIRRFLTSKDFGEFKRKRGMLQDKTEEQLMEMIEKNFLRNLPEGINQDRALDKLTSEELFDIFSSRERESEKSEQPLTRTNLEQLNAEQENLMRILNDKNKKYEQMKSEVRGKDTYEKTE